jgi:hypothetical protein
MESHGSFPTQVSDAETIWAMLRWLVLVLTQIIA